MSIAPRADIARPLVDPLMDGKGPPEAEEVEQRPDGSPSRARLVPLLLAAAYVLLAIPALHDVGIPLILVITGLLGIALIALSASDIATMRLPDAITLPLIPAGIALAWIMGWDNPAWRAASAVIGYGVLFAIARGYLALRGRAGLGMGDAKLFAAAGAWLGLGALPSVMLWACGTALAAVLLAVAFRRPITGTTRFPFGPFLALGFWMVWLYGSL
jgi:leader peptidase (prepilin peptidase)/N-methyltransferase